jgi:hypothetical protein
LGMDIKTANFFWKCHRYSELVFNVISWISRWFWKRNTGIFE